MIWVDGRIVPDDSLAISVLDRTFEHGLGLFETLRTWGGRPTLLDEHKARMLRSAEELKIPIDPASLPEARDISQLLEAEGHQGDRMLRITATGGTSSGKSVVWMRSGPLPPTTGEDGASLLLDAWTIAPDDALARHKTLNYWSRRRASGEAQRRGCDEALSRVTEEFGHHYYYEGSRTNLFLIRDWRFGSGPLGIARPTLLTASEAGPIVPGVMRRLVLDIARELPIKVEEDDGIDDEWIDHRCEIFLTNAVRGIIPVGRAIFAGKGPEYRWTTPGRWTRRLQELVARRLWPDRGTTP
jgi:branched-subunit amino acid aminotransferase/4-amino-4-deoxychorismate lyase